MYVVVYICIFKNDEVILLLLFSSHTLPLIIQNHNEDGEATVKANLAKLGEDMQEQFRKLEE